MAKIIAQGYTTLTKLDETIQIKLSNDITAISCYSDGVPKLGAFTTADTYVEGFRGSGKIPAVELNIGKLITSKGVEAESIGNRIFINDLTEMSGYVDIPVSIRDNFLGMYRFNVVKQIDGLEAASVRIVGESVFKYSSSNEVSPEYIHLSAIVQNIKDPEFSWYYKTEDGVFEIISVDKYGALIRDSLNNRLMDSEDKALYTSSGTLKIPSTDEVLWGNRRSLVIRCSVSNQMYDEFTITKIKDGSEAYTVILTNENHSFAADDEGYIKENKTTTTEVVCYRGIDRVNPTSITLPEVKPFGLNWSLSESTITFTALEGSELADAGAVPIEVNIEDKVKLQKDFTWTKVKNGKVGQDGTPGQPGAPGPQGEAGEAGPPGVGYALNIIGGNRGIAYSAIGTNPEPAEAGTFVVELLKNGEKIPPTKISWIAGGNYTGNSSEENFTPTVSKTYNETSTFVKVDVWDKQTELSQTIPIVCTKHADGLDWLEDWNDNSVLVDKEGKKIVSPKMFAGTKDASGRITGVALGRDVLNNSGVDDTTGVVGYKNSVPVFSLSDKADFYVSSKGSAGSVVNGSANGMYFDGNKLYVTGEMQIQSGTIGSGHTSIDSVVNNANNAVGRGDVVSSINLSKEGIKIQANKLELQGLVTDEEFTKMTIDVNGIKASIGEVRETADGNKTKLSEVTQTISSITSKVEKVEQTSEKNKAEISEVTQTVDKINSKVSSAVTTAEEAKTQVSEVTQTVNGVTTKVESAVTTAEQAKKETSEIKQTVNGISSKVDLAVQTATDAKSQVTSIKQSVGEIKSTVEETRSGLEVLQEEFKDYEQSASEKIDSVIRNQSAFEVTVNGVFKDGVISEAEAKILRDRLLSLEKEREEINKEYDRLFVHPNLADSSEKEALKTSKLAVDSSCLTLIQGINGVIVDGKASQEEVLSVNKLMNAYKTNLGLYKQAYVSALNKVGSKYSDVALEQAKIHTNSEIKQTKKEISLSVSSVENKVAQNASDIRRAEQKITPDAIVSTVTSSTAYQNDKKKQDNAISAISQKAGNIELSVQNKVGNNEIISKINLSKEGVKIKASKVEIEGDFLVKDDLTNGSTLIQGATIKSGTISGTNIKGSNINGANIQGTKMLYMAEGGTMSCDGKTYIKDLFIPETHSGWSGTGAFACGPSAFFDNSVHVGQRKGELWIGNQGVIKRSRKAWIQIDKMGIQNTSKPYIEVAGYNSNHVYGVDIWYSDSKLKDNISVVTSSSRVKAMDSSGDKIGLDLINSINHYNYDFNSYKKVEGEAEEVITTQVDCGYIAQNLQEHNSQLVQEITQGDGEVLLSPRPSAIIPNITLAIQEQQQQIDELSKIIAAQQKQIETLLKLINEPQKQ